jgi:hypothetical protein
MRRNFGLPFSNFAPRFESNFRPYRWLRSRHDIYEYTFRAGHSQPCRP